MARHPESLVDFENRLAAVQTFLGLEEAASLSAANKRIANILKQAEGQGGATVRQKLLADGAEQALFEAMREAAGKLRPLLEERRYAEALSALAALACPWTGFLTRSW